MLVHSVQLERTNGSVCLPLCSSSYQIANADLCYWCRYEPNPPVANFTVGYAYAIATTSNVVMQYLKSGCALMHGANSKMCTYTIDYPNAVVGARRR